jgi:hypothetical protein
MAWNYGEGRGERDGSRQGQHDCTVSYDRQRGDWRQQRLEARRPRQWVLWTAARQDKAGGVTCAVWSLERGMAARWEKGADKWARA